MAFHQTDAMGVMHHANYLHLLETSRVEWIAEHDRPYREFVDRDLHLAVTRVDVHYRRPARFDDALEVLVTLDGVGAATLNMRYEIRRDGELLATARTEHAMLDGNGRPTRIPAETRNKLKRALETQG